MEDMVCFFPISLQITSEQNFIDDQIIHSTGVRSSFVAFLPPLLTHVTGKDESCANRYVPFLAFNCTTNTSAEGTITTDKRVGAAIMFGQSKFQSGVLISPASAYEFDPTNEKDLAEFRGSIWQDSRPLPDACIDAFP